MKLTFIVGFKLYLGQLNFARVKSSFIAFLYPKNFDFMITRMKETEKLLEAELGRPFSVITSNPKYNADYLDYIIRTKWLKILNEKEKEAAERTMGAAH